MGLRWVTPGRLTRVVHRTDRGHHVRTVLDAQECCAVCEKASVRGRGGVLTGRLDVTRQARAQGYPDAGRPH